MEPRDFDDPQETPDAEVLTGEDVTLDAADLDDVAIVGEIEFALEQLDGDEAPSANEDAIVDYSTAEELTETTDVIDTAFTAPRREDIYPGTPDVLEHRNPPQPRPAAHIPPVETETAVTETVVTDAATDTTVMRRSLVSATAEPAAPEQPAPTPDFESHLLDGATIKPEVPSRAGTRWLSAIGTLILTPIVWYLLADSGARLFLAENNPWETGVINIAALSELAGGIALLVVIGVLAAQSSLGLLLAGICTLIVGIPFLVAPTWTDDIILDGFGAVTDGWGVAFDNALFHLEFTGATGLITIAGSVMLIGSWLAWRMRRKGRAEEALRADVAAVNPDGLKARWARKATQRQVSQY